MEECRNVRTLVVKSRPSQKIHPDVDKLEEDVRKLRMRWEHTCSQIIERYIIIVYIESIFIINEYNEDERKYTDNFSYKKVISWSQVTLILNKQINN